MILISLVTTIRNENEKNRDIRIPPFRKKQKDNFSGRFTVNIPVIAASPFFIPQILMHRKTEDV